MFSNLLLKKRELILCLLDRLVADQGISKLNFAEEDQHEKDKIYQNENELPTRLVKKLHLLSISHELKGGSSFILALFA